ncbi:MAG: methyltransferase domain-containing protein [Chloroherpetonaceae bacterium]|nr:methyltransferase domain-containing protein [Chthonomonadaceae bacterium]MDW8207289.1 methyltransferase domain-containing protein [Chloroherpetonaceae bacterium]
MSCDDLLPGRPAHETVQPLEFGPIAPYYDELMQDVPYASWVSYVQRLLTQWELRPNRVLDLACGTGTLSELLHRQGYRVTGVDLSPDMIAVARHKALQKRLPITYYVQDAADLDLPEKDFHLCVSLFDSLNYILKPSRLACAIQRVAAHLVPGGLFLFDMNSEYALANQFFTQDNLNTDARLRYDWDSVYLPEQRLCRVDMRFWYREDNGSVRTFHEVHWQYAYREEEVRTMLQEAGFQQVRTYHAYTLRPPHATTDRIFYAARKSR